MIVEDAIRSAHYSLAVPVRIPRHAHTRLNVVGVGLNSFLQSEEVISGLPQRSDRFESRRNLDIIAYAIVQSEVGANFPRVLPEGAELLVVKRVAGTSESLNEISRESSAVSLYCIQYGE